MVTTIIPAVGRTTPKYNGWLALSVLHALGNAVGGAAAGALFGLLGRFIAHFLDLPSGMWALTLTTSVVFSLADLQMIPCRIHNVAARCLPSGGRNIRST